MATCGYICPKCEGRGIDELGSLCDWCQHDGHTQKTVPTQEEVDQWIINVHEKSCCSDQA